MLLSDAEIYSRRQGKMQEQIREPAAKIEIWSHMSGYSKPLVGCKGPEQEE